MIIMWKKWPQNITVNYWGQWKYLYQEYSMDHCILCMYSASCFTLAGLASLFMYLLISGYFQHLNVLNDMIILYLIFYDLCNSMWISISRLYFMYKAVADYAKKKKKNDSQKQNKYFFFSKVVNVFYAFSPCKYYIKKQNQGQLNSTWQNIRHTTQTVFKYNLQIWFSLHCITIAHSFGPLSWILCFLSI